MTLFKCRHLAFIEYYSVLAEIPCVYGTKTLHDVRWLPCQFRDETVQINNEGHKDIKFYHRNAGLQFGNARNSPVDPNVITFLVITSQVDMRHYMENADDSLECEIQRYNTKGIVMRWPGSGAQEHDVWFTCHLQHGQGMFHITTFLRHTPAQNSLNTMLEIGDRDLLITSATMVVLTRTPVIHVGLMREQILHCQFAVDHKQANVMVEWVLQRRGERTKLFSYSSHTGKSEGSGMSVKTIASGNASLKIPLIKQTSEGTYTCSVLIPPLDSNTDIVLNVQEPPRVTLNVGSTLSLTLGEEQKVVCDTQGYYPLDVTIDWLREGVSSGLLPEVLKNTLYSSHRHHEDGTYSLSAYFLLKPNLEDSGYRYTCRVQHQSLRTHIRKSFTLIVNEQDFTLWYLLVCGFMFSMLGILIWIMPEFIAGKSYSQITL
ncbi:Tapasin-related protein [Bagarius yarrelli]|uniref:Tapasin-related protein n=1 Tax=Bagarius yarrelli TaxID=175774 RepID=A0A556U6Y3_BAGYA|nr:Tapasin-related protein [Bagarius yarrelli]